MTRFARFASLLLLAGVVLLILSVRSLVPAVSAANDAKSDLPRITTEELVKMLKSSGEKPAMFQVGFHTLYAQAHIPGSEYTSAASTDVGLKQLQARAEALPRNKFIVLYCGCCPWNHCPNVKPAYEKLRVMGFSNLKVLYIADNFGTDWVDKGYPVAKGD